MRTIDAPDQSATKYHKGGDWLQFVSLASSEGCEVKWVCAISFVDRLVQSRLSRFVKCSITDGCVLFVLCAESNVGA